MAIKTRYIGDAAFVRLLGYYNCPTPFHVVKMRILGGIASPNKNLAPIMVFSSFWTENTEPKLQTKKEAEIFFSSFMGLWDKMAKCQTVSKVKLTNFSRPINSLQLQKILLTRTEEVDFGFVEGFWGGLSNVDIPQIVGQLIDSISETAEVYSDMLKEVRKNPNDDEEKLSNAYKNIEIYDKTIERAMSALLRTMYNFQKTKNVDKSATLH
jgi:hypothetical protein